MANVEASSSAQRARPSACTSPRMANPGGGLCAVATAAAARLATRPRASRVNASVWVRGQPKPIGVPLRAARGQRVVSQEARQRRLWRILAVPVSSAGLPVASDGPDAPTPQPLARGVPPHRPREAPFRGSPPSSAAASRPTSCSSASWTARPSRPSPPRLRVGGPPLAARAARSRPLARHRFVNGWRPAPSRASETRRPFGR